MSDKIMAVFALATMVAFLAVIAVWVPSVDLMVVIALVTALTVYDFWRTLQERGKP
jgi:hypothetical protein